MPNFDGTGPRGAGPATGRRMGHCFGPGMGGFGWGRGSGRGFGRWNCPFCSWFGPKDKKEQKEYLNQCKKDLEEELKDIQDDLDSLGKDK